MSDIAIRVENLSKAYRIGLKEQIPDTLVGAMASWMRSPLRNFHNLRRLNTFQANGEAEDIVWALKDVSFDVKEGEVIGIIGRNGAGKSTLLKILSRITDPTSGEATIRGRVSSLLEVGTGFHPELTGRENIYMNGTILGMSKREIDRKFDEIVDFSGVEKFLDTPIKRYSSGMKVRLAFSVAAYLEPEILVIDEVLAVGDAEFQRKCLGKMGEVAHSGRTVLFVSHSMPAVERLCHRVLIIERGRIVCSDEPATAIQLYLFRQSQAENGEWRREAPFPSHPHFRRVFLMNLDGTRCVAPTSSGSFGVGVEFCLPSDCPGLLLGLGIDNGMQHPLFATSPVDSNHRLPDSPGVYQATVFFPEGLFMPKDYQVRVALYRRGEIFDSQPGALSFRVAESASLANSVSGGRVGDLQIHCRWSSIEQLEPAD